MATSIPASRPAYARKKVGKQRATRSQAQFAPGDMLVPGSPDDATPDTSIEEPADTDQQPSNVRGMRPARTSEQGAKRKTFLEASIARQIADAINARQNSGIEQIWADAEDLYNGIDSVSMPNSLVKTRDNAPRKPSAADDRSKVFVNITKPKTQVGVARITEMLLPTDDRPWAYKPTAIPELGDGPEASQPVTLSDGSQADPTAVRDALMQQAKEAAKRCEDWVEDCFEEGHIYGEMRKVLANGGRIGTGIIKGPVPVSRTERTWEFKPGQAKLKVFQKKTGTSVSVDARDFFPDPSCGDDIQRGGFVVERDYMTGRILRALARDPGYDADAVAAALAEGPIKGIQYKDPVRRRMEGESWHEASLFEVFYYYGFLQPEDLLLLNPEAALNETELELAVVPVRVTVLNGRAILSVVSPNEKGDFPYDVFAYEKVDGQIWGRGIPHKMATAQKILNGAVRALMENAGVSAGPQVVITQGCLVPANGRYEIVGRKLWFFHPKDDIKDVNKAMTVFDVPSVQKELQAIIAFALQLADILTNIPLLMQGDQKADTSPETLGGLKMLMGNATSPLRVIAKNADDDLFLPHLRRWYDFAMQYAPDDCKGDHEIVARGSTALLQREEGKEFLTQLGPVKNDPTLRINPVKWIREVARAWGYDITDIQFTDDEWKQIQANTKPQEDPRIVAAQENAKSRVEVAQVTQQALSEREVEDRKLRAAELEIQRETAMLTYAAKMGVSLEETKKELAIAAADNQLERENMALKTASDNPSGTGVIPQGKGSAGGVH